MEDTAAERKRKRLEAWRRRQQSAAPAPKVSISLGTTATKLVKKKKKKRAPAILNIPQPSNPFGDVDDDDDERSDSDSRKRKALLMFEPEADRGGTKKESGNGTNPSKRRKGSRWDAGPAVNTSTASAKLSSNSPIPAEPPRVDDALDKFMAKLEAGALGSVATQLYEKNAAEMLQIDVAGSVMRIPKLKQAPIPPPLSGGAITPDEIAKLATAKPSKSSSTSDADALYTQSDWESDAVGDTSEVSSIENMRTFSTISICVNSRIMSLRFLFSCFSFDQHRDAAGNRRRRRRKGEEGIH